MSNFGIEGYQPDWLSGLSTISAAHGARLESLVGRSLTHAWVVWDLDNDEWFSDGPVLFDFDGEQVEVNHYKFDDLSLTWNSVDPARPINWPGTPEYPLAWRDDAMQELAARHGETLRAVELSEWTGNDMANGMVSVRFTLTGGIVTVVNALDENGLEFESP